METQFEINTSFNGTIGKWLYENGVKDPECLRNLSVKYTDLKQVKQGSSAIATKWIIQINVVEIHLIFSKRVSILPYLQLPDDATAAELAGHHTDVESFLSGR